MNHFKRILSFSLLTLALSLLAPSALLAQTGDMPVPLSADKAVVYTEEVQVPNQQARAIRHAAAAWLLINQKAESEACINEKTHFSCKFYLTVPGISTLSGTLNKGDFTCIISVQAFQGRYIAIVDRIRTTDPIKPQTIAERYLMDYETWKKQNSLGLSGEERLRERYARYQKESKDALTHLDRHIRKLLGELKAYVTESED